MKNPDLETVIAAGGAVYKKGDGNISILLIYRNGVWDLPKGKLEPDESVEDCAVREVAEEVGISQLPKIDSELGDTVHYYSINGSEIKKITHWYLMSFENPESEFVPQEQEGITKVEWCIMEEAKEKVGYENLENVLTEVEQVMSKTF